MGSRVLRVVLGSIDSRRWLPGRLFGPPNDVLGWCRDFRGASIACGLASNIQQLVIARSIQGVGAAFLVPGSLSIISACFDETTRGRAIGTWSGFTAITTAVGPVLGGWLIEHASWRWVFFINVPLAVAVIAISLRHIPESRNATARHVDWLGALLATAGLGGVVYGFIESVNLGWGHPLVFGSLIAGFACLIVFVFFEARVSSPMVPLTLFESRSFSGANLLTLFLYAALGIFFFLFPMNLIQVQGYSTTATGAAALPLILLMFFLSDGPADSSRATDRGSHWSSARSLRQQASFFSPCQMWEPVTGNRSSLRLWFSVWEWRLAWLLSRRSLWVQ